MLQIKKWMLTENDVFSTRCPYCKKPLRFISWSPVFCPKCSEELVNYLEIMDSVDERIHYYYVGDDI
jgi:uncharacterized protein with PIN domain